jgi:biopolymer transport protein ExbB
MTLAFVSTAFAQTLSTVTSTVTAAASSAANPYGLGAIWSQGDWVAKGCLLLLATMSIASWYVLVSKYLELRRLKIQSSDAHDTFSHVHNFSANVAKLSVDNPLRFVADAGQDAARQFAALKPRVDYDTWTIRAIEQALSKVQTRMQEGMAVLATIGSTAPFVGLFGTVWAIYTALVKIGASGQASIDRVAGPVGEALIMTAIGLAVAVPAVFGYNWLLRKNKLALESMRSFGAKLHILLLATTYGGEVVKPSAAQASEAMVSKPKFSETKPQDPEQS